MRPNAALTERILGSLGRALSLPLDLHAFAFLSNHWHCLVTTPEALTVSWFIEHVHSTVAVAVNEIHRWDGEVFGQASQIVVAEDCGACDVFPADNTISAGGRRALRDLREAQVVQRFRWSP